jgi:hypothetical protein
MPSSSGDVLLISLRLRAMEISKVSIQLCEEPKPVRKVPLSELDADTGTASVTVSYSNDGSHTFPALNRPDATKTGTNDQARGMPFGS